MRKITPDKEKAQSLLKMSRKTKNRIKNTNIEKFPSQTLKDYYNVIRQLMEALSCLEGIKIEGKGIHKKLIDWTMEEYSFPENHRVFLQQLRRRRNRISYEGFFIEEHYLLRNQEKLEKVINEFSDDDD